MGDMRVRYFTLAMVQSEDGGEPEIYENEVDTVEITKACFDLLDGEVSTARHTVFDNGCNQICHTKECADWPATDELELVT